jgi:predicted PhzF superfamily epimerase YddE/YHI9
VRIRVIDAFAERAFAGNPAGVCLVERWPDPAWMQQVAAELNLSETAFAHPRPDGDWALRWFTPTVEVDLCGHATLATGHALLIDGLVVDTVRFHTRSGVLAVRVGADITLDFPAAAAIAPVAADPVARALGADPAADFVSRVFLPAVGIPEDPVTGGAHTALAPFWSRRLGRQRLVGYQASARGGVVRTRVCGERVELTGRAVTVIDGEITPRHPG